MRARVQSLDGFAASGRVLTGEQSAGAGVPGPCRSTGLNLQVTRRKRLGPAGMAALRTEFPQFEVLATIPSTARGDPAGIPRQNFSRSSLPPTRTVCFVKHIREGSSADT